MNRLIEEVLTLSEILELKADPAGLAEGAVIESQVQQIQGDQFNMAVFLWYLGNRDLSNLHVYSSVHWTSLILQGTRKTRPCLTSHPVEYEYHFFI